ncbi:MAG TPA: protease complex subunit PrcB family protein [Thermoplasmata archaeon]|nr:protease complex subunit PrcB family protein [Thermoplasmata archaeon]
MAGEDAGPEPTPPSPASSPPRRVTVRTMARGAMCALDSPRRMFFNSGARLLDLLTEAKIEVEASHFVGPPNWTRETAVFVGMGRQNSGGYAVEVVEAWAETRALGVKVRVTRPPVGSNVTMAITSPFHLAVLGARAPMVRFEDV